MKDEFQQQRLHDAYGYVLADPFDELLRLLSVCYLERSWQKLITALKDRDLHVSDLHYGFLHSGTSVIQSEQNPLSYFGWVTTQTEPHNSAEEKPYKELSETLIQSPPRICWGSSHRAYKFDIAEDDHARGLEACIDFATGEVGDWNPRYVLAEGTPTGLWRELVNALDSRDENQLDRVLKTAKSEYSDGGYRIVKGGVSLWMSQGLWSHPEFE